MSEQVTELAGPDLGKGVPSRRWSRAHLCSGMRKASP
jgi:hypothetical protein